LLQQVLTFIRSLPKYHEVHKSLYDALNKHDAAAGPPAKKSKAKKKNADATEAEDPGENDDITFSRDEVAQMVAAMEEADVHSRERLRVVQIAARDGWTVARQLSAVQQGN